MLSASRHGRQARGVGIASAPVACHPHAVTALRARSRSGRVVLDEPTELAEGEGVDLVPLSELVRDADVPLDPADKAALDAALERSAQQAADGNLVPADVVLNRLRARGRSSVASQR